MASEPWRGRVTRPPPVALLSVIGYLLASSVGLAAIGVAGCLYQAFAEPLYLLAAAGFALALWASAWVNRRVVAWWVRRQPPEPPAPPR